MKRYKNEPEESEFAPPQQPDISTRAHTNYCEKRFAQLF